MYDLAVREADWERADTLIHRKFGATLPFGDQVLLASVRSDTAALERLRREAPTVAARKGRRLAGATLEASTWLAVYLDRFDEAERFATAATAPGHRAALRGSAHAFLAGLEIARGRWLSAKAEFEALERLGQADSALVLRALAATLPFLSVPRDDLAAVRSALERWDPLRAHGSAAVGALPAMRPHLRLYLLGLVSSRLGEQDAASRYARELEAYPAPSSARTLVGDLARTIRADVAWQGRRLREAREYLEGIRGEVPLELIGLSYFSEEHARFLRAWLLHRLGHGEEALRWLEFGFAGTPMEVQYRAPTYLLRADILHAAGRRAEAVDYYDRVVRLWADCDPGLRPTVEQARHELARLTSEVR